MNGINGVQAGSPQLYAMKTRGGTSEEAGEAKAEKVKEIQRGEENRPPVKAPATGGIDLSA